MRPMVCHMCGIQAHTSENCSESKCLRCGLSNSSYSHTGCIHCRRMINSNCFLCGGKGHAKSNCPDYWRRFHATVSGPEGAVQRPVGGVDKSHKPLAEIWCCNCGRRGHYLHQCRAYSYSSYPSPVLHVVSYESLIKDTSMFDEDGHEVNGTESVPSNKRQKRKEALREIKEKKRRFRSLTGTPNAYQTSGRRISFSNPATPPRNDSSDEGLLMEDGVIESRLTQAKKTLEELLAEENNNDGSFVSSTKKWRKHQKERRKASNIFGSASFVSLQSHTEKFQSIPTKKRKKILKKSDEVEAKIRQIKPCGSSNKRKKSKRATRDGFGDIPFNNHAPSYGDAPFSSSSTPPNLKNRLDRLCSQNRKGKRTGGSETTSTPKTHMLRNERQMLKLIDQTVNTTKKSTHYALNQILKK